ncbi:MAG: glycosyltransferase [Myxococcaceae bacterium]|jgi:glycosyltransferase involved in cell wall biosynthesis|nr:glycosyltransferase [Myxococcaceae bacterium]
MSVAVSVLLPARDAADTIDAAIESVLAQTFGDFELLAIDDGSRDETRARLDAWVRRDGRVRVWSTGGVGLVGALNEGLSKARGALVARMDADDVSLPDRFRRSIERLHDDASLAGVGTGVEIVRADRPPSPALVAYGKWLSSLTTPERLFADRLIESPLCHPSVTLRRAAIDRVGGWRDGPFPEDWDLWLRLLESGERLVCLPQVLHRWTDHERRLTRTDARYRQSGHTALRADVLARRLAGQPIGIWGAGERGITLAKALLARGARVERFIDVNPRKLGQRIHGARVVWPDDLLPPGAEHVIAAVGASGARAEIRAFLESRGFVETEHYTCAA